MWCWYRLTIVLCPCHPATPLCHKPSAACLEGCGQRAPSGREFQTTAMVRLLFSAPSNCCRTPTNVGIFVDRVWHIRPCTPCCPSGRRRRSAAKWWHVFTQVGLQRIRHFRPHCSTSEIRPIATERVAWSVGLFVGHDSEPCISGWTDHDALRDLLGWTEWTMYKMESRSPMRRDAPREGVLFGLFDRFKSIVKHMI